jgi:hypothetical protein
VGDVDHGGAEFCRNLLDQLDDAGLHRHVERGGRLVEEKQFWVGQERHGNDDALLLTAGDLVRIGAHDAIGIGDAHIRQHFSRPLHRLRLRDALVVDRHLGELLADLHRRVQRRHRLLVDHGDLRAADLSQLLLVHGRHVAALEKNLPAGDAAVAAEILHDGERHGRLAAAGLADNAVRLARHEFQVEIDDRGDLAGAGKVRDGEVPTFKDRGDSRRAGHLLLDRLRERAFHLGPSVRSRSPHEAQRNAG